MLLARHGSRALAMQVAVLMRRFDLDLEDAGTLLEEYAERMERMLAADVRPDDVKPDDVKQFIADIEQLLADDEADLRCPVRHTSTRAPAARFGKPSCCERRFVARCGARRRVNPRRSHDRNRLGSSGESSYVESARRSRSRRRTSRGVVSQPPAAARFRTCPGRACTSTAARHRFCTASTESRRTGCAADAGIGRYLAED
jgi:hypothetical protein